MRFFHIAALLLFSCGHVCAQYKCTGPSGSVSFQQIPCSSGARSERLVVRSDAGAGAATAVQPASVASESSEIRVLRTLEHDRKTRELSEQIGAIERTVAARGDQMSREMEALKSQKSRANNNLAGATWEQSISTEMAAVAQKYRAMNEADLGRLPALRSELTRLQATK
jgi:hypothetical protein